MVFWFQWLFKFSATLSFIFLFNILMSREVYSENYFSIYGGIQHSPKSRVSGVNSEKNAFDFVSTWKAKSFVSPIYYGIRYVHWLDNNAGVSLDFSHSKVYADDETLNSNGFSVLEFSDGLNILTLNYLMKYPSYHNIYWGLGAGITLPHVEIQTTSISKKTFEYQFGGYALQFQLGIEKELSRHFSALVEYKFNYTDNELSIIDGGYLKTKIMVNAFNIGVNYKF